MPVEEQPLQDIQWPCYAGLRLGIGQRLTIPNRSVTKLGFWLYKDGVPPGNVTFRIRKVLGDVLIAEKIWGLANDLPGILTYEEAELDIPVTVNEEVRIAPFIEGGDAANHVHVAFKNGDVKGGELWTQFSPPWGDNATRDGTYRYTWEEPPAGLENKSANMGARLIAGKMI